MKLCTICKQNKIYSCFNRKKSNRDGLQDICRECSNERSRRYYRENKQHHKNVIYKIKDKIINRNRKFIYFYLCNNPCVDCGEKDPIVLEFDHLRDKRGCLSNMVSGGYSISSLRDEISKCEVRCANCHRRKTSIAVGHYMLSFINGN